MASIVSAQDTIDIFRASAIETPGGYQVPVINLESALEYAANLERDKLSIRIS